MTNESPFGPDVVAIHGYTRKYFSSAKSAALGILRELYAPHGIIHRRVARYTADGTVGGEITDDVVAVLHTLPPRPIYAPPITSGATAARAAKSTYTKAMKKWETESCEVLVRALGLR